MRICGSERFMWYEEMAQILKAAFPQATVTTRVAPNFFIRFMGLFDKTIRSIVPILGREQRVSNARAKDVLGMEFRDVAQSVREAGAFLVDNNRL